MSDFAPPPQETWRHWFNRLRVTTGRVIAHFAHMSVDAVRHTIRKDLR